MLINTKNRYQRFLLILTLAAAISPLLGSEAQAYEDEYGIEHSKNEKVLPGGEPVYPGAVTSMEAFREGFNEEDSNSNVLLLTAEFYLKRGNYTDALRLIKIAVKKDYQDIEIHKAYAEALEKKYTSEKKKDPDVYNQCIYEWLMVLRQEVGWEKLTVNGIGTPGIGKFYEDEDQVIPARQHLLTLTGSLPKVWENDTKYLRRVMKPTTTSVTGKVLKKGEATESDKDDKDGQDEKTEKDNREDKDGAEEKARKSDKSKNDGDKDRSKSEESESR